ncbi:cold-inducible protein YdjO-related protein [Bacillus massiliglaciei]|uniref:cold-inducible protein YdjO-related protein n=1 Tax=Bacillus massiliglaciei TaxID=1816693 RepID=UPI000DA630A7|nr:cold-inducible protein YdjO-related protein [Bacillus massiliglaciei]
MYFAKKNSEEPEVIIENTIVYACESDSCNGWMRKEFVTDNRNCPMCGSELLEETRELPRIPDEYNSFK